MLMEIRDDVIWAKHLKSNPMLYEAVLALDGAQTIRLSVDGVIGQWAKMDTGKDGRPVHGIKPVGAMASVWKRLQNRRGETVVVHWPEHEDDPLMRLADMTFNEWNSAEDEEAFGHLQPL